MSAQLTATDDLTALHKAILANPDDNTLRLVYADALDERGEPGDAEQAAFIRAQCWLWENQSCSGCSPEEWMQGKPCQQCDRREDLRGETAVALFGRGRWESFAGEATLLIPDGARWDGHIRFCRGFVHSVTCSAADWLDHSPGVLASQPIREVELTTLPEWARLLNPDLRCHGNEICGQWVAVESHRPATVTGIVAELFAKRWPGIIFTLPPEPL